MAASLLNQMLSVLSVAKTQYPTTVGVKGLTNQLPLVYIAKLMLSIMKT